MDMRPTEDRDNRVRAPALPLDKRKIDMAICKEDQCDKEVFSSELCGTHYHRIYYRLRKQKLFEYLGGSDPKCVQCGSREKLEIDHKNRDDKSFNISENLTVDNPEVRRELDKCQLLCDTCHNLKTAEENLGFTHGTSYAWMRKKCRCDICKPEWQAWNNARKAKRRQESLNSPGVASREPYGRPSEHGEPLNYTRGCRCALCRKANTQKELARLARKKTLDQ